MSLCRFCKCSIKLGSCKDLFMKYLSFGKEEVYSVMIQECFGISLSPTNNNKICRYCIKSLQIAIHFREQILLSEKALLSNLKETEDRTESKVKDEAILETYDENFFEHTLIKVEQEGINEANGRAVSLKPEQKQLASPFTDEKSNRQSAPSSLLAKLSQRKPRSVNIKEHINITISQKSNKHRIKFEREKKDSIYLKSNIKRKHQHNLHTILNYSNAIPFQHKTIYGYVCAYCDEAFPDPLDLRRHTEQKHIKDRLKILNKFQISTLVIRLDVTNLECGLCKEAIPSLKTLKDHLVSAHDKKFYKLKDHILEFKLQAGEKYDCALCHSTHETYKMLKQHMNVHYRNYECVKCGTPFVNSNGLRVHENTHQNGSFKCGHCEKVFASIKKKKYHEKTHKGAHVIDIKCPHCGESFKNYYRRNQHMIEEHNAEMLYRCNICDTGFLLKAILMKHIKRNHLMERNFQCGECSLSFFNSKELEEHKVRHTGVKLYRCEVCTKSYARKKTLKEHMRIHNNDRRFKCQVCLVTFVQKCSLRSHLLTNHGISLSANDIVCSS